MEITKDKPQLNMKPDDSGKVKILRATLYKSHMVYIRMIGNDLFEYLLEYNGQIYSSYNIIKPRKGEKVLSEQDIADCRDLTMAMAETTLDELLGHTVEGETKEYAELFEKNREKVEDATSVQ